MNKTQLKITVGVLAVLLLAGVAAYAATSYGTQTDPLITKSYLEQVVQPKLENELTNRLAEAERGLRASAPGEFDEVKLSANQTLSCGSGCEIVLRSGSARAVGAMADTTDGSNLAAGGSLSTNHLYIAAEESGGVTAGSGGAVVLVSGSYTLG